MVKTRLVFDKVASENDNSCITERRTRRQIK